MQQDGQLAFVIETTDIAAMLGLLSGHGAPSATLHVRLHAGFALIDYLCPPHVSAAQARAIGSRLAAAPACLSVTLQALRHQPHAPARQDIATWPRQPAERVWQAAA